MDKCTLSGFHDRFDLVLEKTGQTEIVCRLEQTLAIVGFPSTILSGDVPQLRN